MLGLGLNVGKCGVRLGLRGLVYDNVRVMMVNDSILLTNANIFGLRVYANIRVLWENVGEYYINTTLEPKKNVG